MPIEDSMKMTVETLQKHLDGIGDGVLRIGGHYPGAEFCALEFESQVRGRKWSDQPITLPCGPRSGCWRAPWIWRCADELQSHRIGSKAGRHGASIG